MAETTTATAPAPSTPIPSVTPTPSPGQAQPAPGSPGVIPDNAYDNLSEADRAKYSRVRAGPDGGSQWQERATLPSEKAPAEQTGQPGATLNPEEKYRFGDLELKGQEILDLLRFKGESDLRRAAVPADPAAYRIELPKDFVPPAGTEWRFNDADPALAAARAWSHANGLSQDQFASLLGQYVAMESTKEATFRAAMKRELDALGANATMRVTALETWLNGVVGPDLAKHMRQGMFSHKIVEGLELIATKFATQGHASFTQHGRVPETGSKGPLSSLPDAEYDKLDANARFRISRLGD
jgi:hypothetical protein